MLEESPAPPVPPPAAPPAAPRVSPSLAALKVLLAINVVMYALEVYLSGPGELKRDVLLGLGANEALSIWGGEYWRLITSAFLHGGLLHLALNMQALFALGSWLEEDLGSLRLFLIYLATALTGSAASVAFGSGGLSVGASGAVFGFVGALLALTFLAPAAQRRSMLATRRQLWFLVALNLGAGFWINRSGAPIRVDNMAHLGGLVGGLLLGVGLFGARNKGPRSSAALGGFGAFGAVCAVLLVLAAAPPPWARTVLDARAAVSQRNTEAMRTLLLEGARQHPEVPDYHAHRHNLCTAVRDDGCRLEALQALVAMDPAAPGSTVDESAVATALGEIVKQALREGDYEVAVLIWRRLAYLFPDDEDILNGYAWSLLMRGHLTPTEKVTALETADRARRIARHHWFKGLIGGDPSIEHTYAEALSQSGRVDDAVAVLRSFLEGPRLRQYFVRRVFNEKAIHEEMERMRAGKPPRDFE